MKYDKVNVSVEGAFARVALNRPEVRNAFDDDLIARLEAVFIELGGNDGVRAIVLTGEGEIFCAGADVNWMRSSVEMTADENRADAIRLAGMLRAIDECPRPVIGAIRGAAIGGGAGLIAACDMVVAAEGTKIGFTEVRLGIVPAAISTFVLPKIGERHARRYFLTGEIFDAVRAREIGLVQEVVDGGDVEETAMKLCRAVARCGPAAVSTAKKLIRDMRARPVDDAIPFTASIIAKVRTSREGQEGLRAFLEKRKPRWIEES